MALTESDVDIFEASRPRLEAIAYRMLGSAADAEDMVSETFLRWQSARSDGGDHIITPEAWLTKVLTNLCLNQLASARARRETYVGHWLPEPLLAGDPMLGPAEAAEQRASVSYAVMVLLERLTPEQRAVYVLAEAFGYPHRDIAQILDITESASQQHLHRARERVESGRVRTQVDQQEAERITAEFIDAATSGRTEPLVALLTAEVAAAGDGGGKVPAVAKPFHGAARVASFIRGLFKPGKAKRDLVGATLTVEAAVVDGDPAIVAYSDQGVFGVMVMQVSSGEISSLHSQVNPDKLKRFSRQWSRREHRGTPRVIPL